MADPNLPTEPEPVRATPDDVEELERVRNRERDGSSLAIIGTFFAVFATLVLIGTFWEDRDHGMVVNIGAGLVLLGIGVAMLFYGLRLRSRR